MSVRPCVRNNFLFVRFACPPPVRVFCSSPPPVWHFVHPPLLVPFVRPPQGYWDTATLGHGTQGHRNTGTLGHLNTKTMGHRNNEWGRGAHLPQSCYDFFKKDNAFKNTVFNIVFYFVVLTQKKNGSKPVGKAKTVTQQQQQQQFSKQKEIKVIFSIQNKQNKSKPNKQSKQTYDYLGRNLLIIILVLKKFPRIFCIISRNKHLMQTVKRGSSLFWCSLNKCV